MSKGMQFSVLSFIRKSNFKFLRLQFAFEYDEYLTGQESLSKVNLSKMKERIFFVFVCLSNDDARLTNNEVSFEGKENFEGSIFNFETTLSHCKFWPTSLIVSFEKR
jgi:hypothetical protein